MIFIDNKYTRWYYSIVENAHKRNHKSRSQAKNALGYVERHRIIPGCLGGKYTPDNAVYLTAKEHFICHLLLPKMVENAAIKNKLQFAIWSMISFNSERRHKISSVRYEQIRTHCSKLSSITQKGRRGPNLGKPMSDLTKKRMSETKKLVNHPPWNKGIARTSKERALMSQRRKETANKIGAWNCGLAHSAETIA